MDTRASDTEREEAVEVLRLAAGEGRLTTEELEERLHAAYGAATQLELAKLTGDLAPATRPGRVPVARGVRGEGIVVSIFGGSKRTGRWTVARRCRVIDVFGGSRIDLREAALASDTVDLLVVAAFGGSSIRIPASLNVEVSQFALFGGNEVRVGETTPDPGGPVVRIRLISVFGGSSVKRRRGTTTP